MAATPPTSAQGAGILGSIGGLISGVGGLVQARQEEELGEFNATIFERQAGATRKSQELLAEQKRKIAESTAGTQVARIAGSGLKFTGSPVKVMIDSLANANMDIAIDNFNSQVKAQGFESDASRSRFEGTQNAARSRLSAGRSFLGVAANNLLSQREIGGGN